MNSKVNNRSKAFFEVIKKRNSFLILILMVGVMSISSEYFFKWTNMMNILKQSSVLGALAIGEVFVIISAGIDLSVGATMAITGCVITLGVSEWGMSPGVAVLVGLLVALAVGVINGLIITKLGLPDFIATLGTSTAMVGLALIITKGYPVSTNIPEGLLVIGGGSLPMGNPNGFPIGAITFIVLAIIGYIILEHTTFGRNVVAIGGNKEASRVSGISIMRTKMGAMIFSALCCGIGGIIMIGRLRSASGTMGTGLELSTIAAVVVGGTSINGGQGSIGNTIIGVFTMSIIQNGLELLNISSYLQKVVLGTVMILVVALDTFRRRRLLKDS